MNLFPRSELLEVAPRCFPSVQPKLLQHAKDGIHLTQQPPDAGHRRIQDGGNHIKIINVGKLNKKKLLRRRSRNWWATRCSRLSTGSRVRKLYRNSNFPQKVRKRAIFFCYREIRRRRRPRRHPACLRPPQHPHRRQAPLSCD